MPLFEFNSRAKVKMQGVQAASWTDPELELGNESQNASAV
jgi:hypothetical protein